MVEVLILPYFSPLSVAPREVKSFLSASSEFYSQLERGKYFLLVEIFDHYEHNVLYLRWNDAFVFGTNFRIIVSSENHKLLFSLAGGQFKLKTSPSKCQPICEVCHNFMTLFDCFLFENVCYRK